jgi:hypothetical protein
MVNNLDGTINYPSWRFGEALLTRIVESEGPLLEPTEIFPDCTATDIAKNISWLAPRFFNPSTNSW